jgi:hypothetical protein
MPPPPAGALQDANEQSLREAVAEALSMRSAPPCEEEVQLYQVVKENGKWPAEVVSKREPIEFDVPCLVKKENMSD